MVKTFKAVLTSTSWIRTGESTKHISFFPEFNKVKNVAFCSMYRHYQHSYIHQSTYIHLSKTRTDRDYMWCCHYTSSSVWRVRRHLYMDQANHVPKTKRKSRLNQIKTLLQVCLLKALLAVGFLNKTSRVHTSTWPSFVHVHQLRQKHSPSLHHSAVSWTSLALANQIFPVGHTGGQTTNFPTATAAKPTMASATCTEMSAREW